MGTWVRAALMFLMFCCILVLIIVTYLLSGGGKSAQDLMWATIALSLLAGISVAMGLPIATVAEVFEYDVLHALNNPLVVQMSQRYFGHQFLAHLHTLSWGFMFGQTIINLRLITNIL